MTSIVKIAREYSLNILKKNKKTPINSVRSIQTKINKASLKTIQKIDDFLTTNVNNKVTLQKLNEYISSTNETKLTSNVNNKFTHPQQLNYIDHNEIIMTPYENSHYTEITHEIQIRKLIKKHNKSDLLYSHEVIYKIKGEITIDTNITYFKLRDFEKKPNKDNQYNDLIKKIIYKNGDGESHYYYWNPYCYTNEIENGPSFYNRFSEVTFRTTMYNNINVDNAEYIKYQESQKFENNIKSTCLYDACISYFNNNKTKPAKAILNKLINSEDVYAKPYTLNESNELAIFIKSSLTFTNLIKNNDTYINKNSSNRYNIPLIITRYGHVEHLLNNFEKQTISKDAYYELKKSSKFYVEKNGSLMTLQGTYVKEDTDYKIISQKWNNDNKINLYYINKQDEVMNILDRYDYSMHRFFDINNIKDESHYNLIDVNKCYYNMLDPKINKFYNGFPSGSFINLDISKDFTINNFLEQFKNNLIGFYQVEIMSIIKKDKIINSILGLKVGTIHVMTSEQINLLTSYITFKFLNCSIAPKINLKQDPTLLQKIDQNNMIADDQNDKSNISIYCKLFGIWKCDNSSYKIEVKTDQENVKNVFNLYDPSKTDRKIYKLNNNVYILEDTNLNYKTYDHLLYYMHAYNKLNIMNTLLNVDCDDCHNIIGVKSDAIVFKKDYDIKYDHILFKWEENSKINNMLKKSSLTITQHSLALDYGLDLNDLYLDDLDRSGNVENVEIKLSGFEYNETKCTTYFINNDDHDLNYEKPFLTNETPILNRLILSYGPGGSGKTHDLITSKINKKHIAYTSCSWLLITNKCKDTNMIPLSTNRLTGDKCEKVKNNNIKYIIIDEITLINKSTIDQIIKDYNHCFIFIIGDVATNGNFYQCTVPQITVINPSSYNFQMVEYTKTYRFDQELDLKLKDMRAYMTKIYNNPCKLKMMQTYTLNMFKDRVFNSCDIIINNDDVAISHCLNNKILDSYFINKGTNERYYIKNTNFEKGQYRGMLIDAKPDHANYETKLFKSVHSFQGQELTQTNKLIINIKSNFDFQLYYTALSRARRVDQIYIINDGYNSSI